MTGHGDIENLILMTIERSLATRGNEHHALVTSYNPKKHLAKVKFMPNGQESGWIPIETGHIGAGYGIAAGLQPGDGKKTGDQVVARYQEGDFETAKIVQRVHSEQDNPPEVKSGEMVLWTKFKKSGGGQNSADGGQGGDGQRMMFKNDGSLETRDGNGAITLKDGLGNITVTAT